MNENSINARLLSTQVGLPQTWVDENSKNSAKANWTTGFYKSAVQGWVQVRRLNLEGDGQADLVHHGGVDKAVLMYSADHFSDWAAELERSDITGGMFGENLTVSGISESTVCIGDQLRINDVVLEVSQPRQPCWKLARRWNVKELPKLVVKNGRSGWYCRVVQTGKIKSGLPIELLHREHHEWTIGRVHETLFHRPQDDESRKKLASIRQLSQSWKTDLLNERS
ncbi:MAG: MOSC domain-containing protein [Mariniblastus sp.]|nr:MOSC domain-containing protein [Mariniblastus sp.]